MNETLFSLLHANPKATVETMDRGSIVNVMERRGNGRDLIVYVVDDVELAKRIFTEEGKKEAGNGFLQDNPAAFGLEAIPLSKFPEPHLSEWTIKFGFNPGNKERR